MDPVFSKFRIQNLNEGGNIFVGGRIEVNGVAVVVVKFDSDTFGQFKFFCAGKAGEQFREEDRKDEFNDTRQDWPEEGGKKEFV